MGDIAGQKGDKKGDARATKGDKNDYYRSETCVRCQRYGSNHAGGHIYGWPRLGDPVRGCIPWSGFAHVVVTGCSWPTRSGVQDATKANSRLPSGSEESTKGQVCTASPRRTPCLNPNR
jgi:hypothetical protein